MKGGKLPHSKLAGYGERGPIRINPKIPWQFHNIRVRERVLRHERVERKLRIEQGLTYKKAHKIALKKEHEGLTHRQIQVYEGLLGSIARRKKT